MTIGDGDCSGTHDGVDKTILTIGHGNMVDPNISRPKDGDAIAIALCSKPIMVHRISNHSTWFGDNVVDVKVMDDHIVDKLNGEASAVGNVDIGATSVDGLVARDH